MMNRFKILIVSLILLAIIGMGYVSTNPEELRQFNILGSSNTNRVGDVSVTGNVSVAVELLDNYFLYDMGSISMDQPSDIIEPEINITTPDNKTITVKRNQEFNVSSGKVRITKGDYIEQFSFFNVTNTNENMTIEMNMNVDFFNALQTCSNDKNCDHDAFQKIWFPDTKVDVATIIADFQKLDAVPVRLVNLSLGSPIQSLTSSLNYKTNIQTIILSYPEGTPLTFDLEIGFHSASFAYEDDSATGTLATNCTAPTTIASVDVVNNAGDNITLVVPVQLKSSDATAERVPGGNLKLINRSGGILDSNSFELAVNTANTFNDYVFLYKDANSTANNRYNITGCSDLTAVQAQAKWMVLVNTNTSYYKFSNISLTAGSPYKNFTVNTSFLDNGVPRYVISQISLNATNVTTSAATHVLARGINVSATASLSSVLLDQNEFDINLSTTRPNQGYSSLYMGWDNCTGGGACPFSGNYTFQVRDKQITTSNIIDVEWSVIVLQLENATYTNGSSTAVGTTPTNLVNISTNYPAYTPMAIIYHSSFKDTNAGAKNTPGGSFNISDVNSRLNFSNAFNLVAFVAANAAGSNYDKTVLGIDYASLLQENYTGKVIADATGVNAKGRMLLWQAGDPNPPYITSTLISPTQASSASVSINNTIINLSILNNTPIDTISFNWNQTANITIDDPSLIWYLNMNNNTDDWSRYNKTNTRAGGLNCSKGDVSYFDTGCNSDGVNDGVSATFSINANRTIELWAKWNGGGAGSQTLFYAATDGWEIGMDANNGSLYLFDGTIRYLVIITAGQWFHLAVVCETGRAVVFFNGVNSRNVTPYTCNTITSQQIFADWTTQSWSGSMDEVRVWNRALNRTEIQQSWKMQRSKFNQTNYYVNTSNQAKGSYFYNFTINSSLGVASNISETRCIDLVGSTTCPPTTPQLNIVSPANTTYINSTINITYTGTSNVNCRIEMDGVYNMSFRFCQNYTLSSPTFGNDTNVSLALDFSERQGTTLYDKSVFGLNVSMGGDAAFNSTNFPRANYSSSISFISTGFLNATANASLGNLWTGNATLCAWIYPTTYGGSNLGRIADKATDNIGTGGWEFGVGNDGIIYINTIQFRHSATTTGIFRAAQNVITTNAWNHVCVSYDKGSTNNIPSFWVNGSLVATTTVTGPAGIESDDVTVPLLIGNDAAKDRGFSGTMDDVVIFDRGLSSSDVLKLYQEQAFNGTHTIKIYTNSTTNNYNSTSVTFSISPPVSANTCSPTNGQDWTLDITDNCYISGTYNILNWYIKCTNGGKTIIDGTINHYNTTWINPLVGTCTLAFGSSGKENTR